MYTVQEWNSILLYCGDNVAYNMYMFTVHQSTVKYCTYGTVWRTIYKYEQCTGINSILLYCRHSVAYNLYTCTLYRNEQYTTVLRAQCGVKYKYVHCTGMNSILLYCGHSVAYNINMYTVQEWTVYCCTAGTVWRTIYFLFILSVEKWELMQRGKTSFFSFWEIKQMWK